MFSLPFLSFLVKIRTVRLPKDILSGPFEGYAEFSATWQHGGGGPYLVWFGVRGPTATGSKRQYSHSQNDLQLRLSKNRYNFMSRKSSCLE